MIAVAEAGDIDIAREVVEELAHMVAFAGSTNKIPRAAAAYLARALTDIAAGEDAKAVFNLKLKGRPREWPHDAKVLAVSLMNQLIKQQGLSIDEAATQGSIEVNRHVEALAGRRRAYFLEKRAGNNPAGDTRDFSSPWKVFISRDRLNIESGEPMKSWYLELLNSKKKRRKRASPHR